MLYCLAKASASAANGKHGPCQGTCLGTQYAPANYVPWQPSCLSSISHIEKKKTFLHTHSDQASCITNNNRINKLN